MAKTLAINNWQWLKLRAKIVEEYGQSTVLISWRLKDTLGFTVREHRNYADESGWNNSIRLDFWDDQLQTMFLLKYSDYLDAEF